MKEWLGVAAYVMLFPLILGTTVVAVAVAARIASWIMP